MSLGLGCEVDNKTKILIDLVYHSTLGLRIIKKKKNTPATWRVCQKMYAYIYVFVENVYERKSG